MFPGRREAIPELSHSLILSSMPYNTVALHPWTLLALLHVHNGHSTSPSLFDRHFIYELFFHIIAKVDTYFGSMFVIWFYTILEMTAEFVERRYAIYREYLSNLIIISNVFLHRWRGRKRAILILFSGRFFAFSTVNMKTYKLRHSIRSTLPRNIYEFVTFPTFIPSTIRRYKN